MTCCRCRAKPADYRSCGRKVIILLCAPCVWLQDISVVRALNLKPLSPERI